MVVVILLVWVTKDFHYLLLVVSYLLAQVVLQVVLEFKYLLQVELEETVVDSLLVGQLPHCQQEVQKCLHLVFLD